MKKITLMLCACAMAFAGLLVSCSNGTEKWINGTEQGSEYVYAITGTVTESEETGTTGSTTVTTDVYTFTKGRGAITLDKVDSQKENNDKAITGYISFGGKADKSHKEGSAEAVKTYNVSYSQYMSSLDLTKLDDNWYIGFTRYNYNNSGNYIGYTMYDKVKLETVPEFDGSDYNLKVTLVKDNSDSEAGTVSKKTISFDISYKAVDAE